MNQKKGRLSGAALNDKLFVVGGGNGVDSFSDVEMLELDIFIEIRLVAFILLLTMIFLLLYLT